MAHELGNGYVVDSADGQVVTHPALTDMAYQESIQPWIASYFPDAKYYFNTAARVSASSVDLSQPGLVVLQAPKGTGKSKAIRHAAAALPAHTSVLQITFRRSLAWSSAAMLGPGSTLYSDVQSGSLSARQHPRLTIVVNSIARVRGSYDIVIIDEIVSVLDMLASTLLQPEARVHACSTLAQLIGCARTVVIADAMLDSTCMDFVLICRRMAAQPAADGWFTTPFPVKVHDYVTRLHSDYAYIPYAFARTWATALDAALKRGSKCVVPCMTKAQALKLAERYSRSYRVQVYTGDTPPAILQAHMLDIHTHWSRADVLIYSPVITAGCSFELPHFDEIFFYGHAGLSSVRSAIQMIARVRDVRLKTVHVYIAKGDSFQMIPTGSNTAPLFSTISSYTDGYMKLLHLLGGHRTAETLCAGTAFPYYFWSLVVHSGAKIRFPAKRDQQVAEIEIIPVSEPPPAVKPPPVACNAVGEVWWCHDWDKQPQETHYEIDAALAVSGTLLERAAKLRPNHLMDIGVLPLPTRQRIMTPGPLIASILPAWVTPELVPRVRAWVLLMARKSVSAALPVIHNPPTFTRVKHVRAEPLQTTLQKCVARYMDPDTGWMDIIHPAWCLAGLEISVRTGVQPDPDAILAPMPSGCMTESMLIADRVNNALVTLRAASVTTGCVIGTGSSPFRFHASSAVVDFVIKNTDGKEVLLQLRVEGQPSLHAATDLCKLTAVAAAADGRFVSVHILYVNKDELITCALPSAASTGLVSLALSSPAYVKGWGVRGITAYVFSEAGTVTVRYKGVEVTYPNCQSALAATSGPRRWVTWNSAGASAAVPMCDLGALIANQLAAVTNLDIYNARTVGVEHGDAVASPTPAAQLEQLFIGLCKTGFLVYFWNNKPIGISINAFPWNV
jgi:hypothetical protein